MWKLNSDNKLPHEAIEKFNRLLLERCAKLGFECVQVNGQRICTSVSYTEKPNPKGTEIFIGKIPRNTFEDELIPLFMKAGKLYRFRLMLDFSLKNRGFAFATYMTAEDAEKAIALFDNYEIRPKFKMGVFKSVDNCRLFFGNIPQTFTQDDISKVLNDNQIEGITEIIMYKDLLNPRLNRGYVFVEFSSHRNAAMARKQLYPGCLIVEGQAVFVDWADPIPDVDPKVMAKVTKLFLHHLPVNINKEALSKYIGQFINMNTVIKVHKQMDYAFIHFVDRKMAEMAKAALKALPFPGVVIEWARPREYSKQLRLESPPTHFCLSLPPKMRRHYQQFIINNFTSDSSSNGSQQSSPNQQNRAKPSCSTSIKKNFKHNTLQELNSNLGGLEELFQSQLTIPRNLNYNRNDNRSFKDADFYSNINDNRGGIENFVNVNVFPPTRQNVFGAANMRTKPLHHNPLIGLPISPLPLELDQMDGKENLRPLELGNRPNNHHFRNAFPQRPYYNNGSSLFSSDELVFQQAPQVSNMPMVPNHLGTTSLKPVFEFF